VVTAEQESAPTIEFWGVRGSLPSPGADTVRYGGNTSCVAVRPSEDHLIVLDAGSGIRPLSTAVDASVQRVDILMTHLHMDHIQGLGFFGPLFDPGLEIHMWGPRSAMQPFQTRLMRYLSAPLFPVHLHDLPCKLWLHDTPLDTFEVGDVRAAAALVCHPGSTVGYRLRVGDAVVAYLPDHEPALGSPRVDDEEWCSGHDLARDADVLVHDAQYDIADYEDRIGWGHSAWEHTLDFARAVGARRVVPFHFDPTYSDDRLDALFAAPSYGSGDPEIIPAKEGLALPIGGVSAHTAPRPVRRG
jgi:phosphoribosyl 1,2-cyclic phosphodiesterase